jgi:hypothetical protein
VSHTFEERSFAMKNDKLSLVKAVSTGLLVGSFFLVSWGCGSSMPRTFSRNSPGWIIIEVAEGLDKDTLWGKVADAIKERDLEFEKVDKDAGYMRTSWSITWTGKETYATRVIVDFPSSVRTIRVKTEARYARKEGWIIGWDTHYNETFKDDIEGVVGRK